MTTSVVSSFFFQNCVPTKRVIIICVQIVVQKLCISPRRSQYSWPVHARSWWTNDTGCPESGQTVRDLDDLTDFLKVVAAVLPVVAGSCSYSAKSSKRHSLDCSRRQRLVHRECVVPCPLLVTQPSQTRIQIPTTQTNITKPKTSLFNASLPKNQALRQIPGKLCCGNP